jgi:type IV secretion system protein VirD4
MNRQLGDGSWSVFELAMAAVVGALVAGGVLVILIGGLAGWLFGRGWPDTNPSALGDIVAALPDHVDDPRRAWPASARADLPGPVGFYATAVVLTAGGAVTVLAFLRFAKSRKRDKGASWGRGSQLKLLRVRPGERGRLVLGRIDRHLVASEPRQSVIVVAPTQSGKTTGLAIPSILEWTGPVLATSVKTDLVLDTIARRRAMGAVHVFDPSGVTGLPRAQWTPLARCASWQGARETAARLVSVAQPGRGLSDADFWAGAAARYLAPLLFTAAQSERTISDVLGWIETGEEKEIRSCLAAVMIEDDPGPFLDECMAALKAIESVWTADERLRSSLGATAGVALDAYGDPVIADCAVAADIAADKLLAGPNTVYLCATALAQERLRPLFVTLIDEIVGYVYEQSASRGRPLDAPLLIVLDEAANIAPLPRLDQLAATGAGQGIQLVTVVQDLAQLEERWGTKADTILNNHRAKVFGSGISCEKTLTYVARVLGDESVSQRSTTRGERGAKSETEGVQFRPLAPADRLRQERPGTGVLLYGHLPPARITLRPWFADRRLRSLAAAGEGP